MENARELGVRRRDDGIDLVVTSDLPRAVRTVEIAFEGSSVPVRADARLREVDYGDLTGAPAADIERQRRRRVDSPFPHGQSYRRVAAAVRTLLEELAAEPSGERILLVGHAATRYALDHLLTGRPLETAVVGPFSWRPGWEYRLTEQLPELVSLSPTEAAAAAVELAAVYRSAFTAPEYGETEESVVEFRDEQLPTHAGRPGFRCVVSRESGTTVGFAYGYTGARGQWWSDQIAGRAPKETVDAWLGGHFEFVELAVDRNRRGQGRGTALHDRLLLHTTEPRALLTTFADDRPAPRLYRRLGWQLLHRDALPGSDLYGLDLAAWRTPP